MSNYVSLVILSLVQSMTLRFITHYLAKMLCFEKTNFWKSTKKHIIMMLGVAISGCISYYTPIFFIEKLSNGMITVGKNPVMVNYLITFMFTLTFSQMIHKWFLKTIDEVLKSKKYAAKAAIEQSKKLSGI